MIKNIASVLGVIGVIAGSYFYFLNPVKIQSREEYERFINNHPYQRLLRAGEHEQEGENETEEATETDRPDLAMMQNFLQTMDPTERRPTPEILTSVNKYTASARQKKTNSNSARTSANSLASGTQWLERGPNNVAGRTRAIMFDPNDVTGKKVWAGGVAGGLWFNDDITSASSTWTKVDDLWDNLAITCIAPDPLDKSTFYVGTGEGWFNSDAVRGAGIWKTTDKGVTWSKQPLPNTSTFYFVNDIVVRNEAGASVIYAAVRSTNNGLFRSTDGGVIWTQVLPAPAISNTYPTDIEIGKDNRIYVGSDAKSSSGKTAIYSSDAGLPNSWTTLEFSTFNGRIELACSPSNENIVYAVIIDDNKVADIVKSVDKGVSYTSVSKPVDADLGIPSNDFSRGQGWYDLIIAVDPSDANNVYVGGVDLFQSKDGGTSWKQISKWSNNPNLNTLPCSEVHADQHNFIFRPGSSNEAVVSNDGGVYYASNLSVASTSSVFSVRNLNYNVTQFYSAAIHPTSADFMLAGAQDNGTQKYSSAGIGSTITANGGDGAFCFIDQKDPTFQIASYVYNSYKLSTNGGTSFTIQLLDDEDNGNFINQAEYDANLKILFSARSTTAIYRVRNVTTTREVDSVKITGLGTMATAFRVSPYATSASNLYVGTAAGKLFKVLNANAAPSIIEITGSSFPNGSISSIAFGASESQIMVTFFNYGVVNIWETRDGGNNWVSREGNLPNMPVRWVEYHPLNPDQLYIATELGVWSTDNVNVVSPIWKSANGGLANVRTDMLRIRNSDFTIMAATHGRGVFTALIPSNLGQIISFKAFSPKTLIDKSFKIWAQSTSNLPITFASSNVSVATVVDSTVTIVGMGTTDIIASQMGNAVFNAALQVSQPLMVTKAEQTISFKTVTPKTLNDTSFKIWAQSSSGLPITFTSSNQGVATVVDSTVTIVGAGTTDLTTSQMGNAVYNAALPVSQQFTVTKAVQAISFKAFTSKKYGDPSFKIWAQSSSGLPITFNSTNVAVATVVDSTVTIVGGGTTILVASQSGNPVYKSATPVNQELIVNKAAQTITFGLLPERDTNDPAFTIAATSSSALPVSFTSSTPNVATVEGNTITIIGSGTTTIKAYQLGNSNFIAATNITQNLTVVTRIFELPESLDFGDVFLGEDDQKTFPIKSIGTGNITISNTTYPTGYTGETKTTGSITDVTVTFKPVNVIDYLGNITIESDATSGVNTITIKGKGVKITERTEQQLSEEFEVYPNSANDIVYIKTKMHVTTVELVDSQGRTSNELVTRMDDNTSQFDISKYAAGKYFLRIPTATGQIIKQIVKN